MDEPRKSDVTLSASYSQDEWLLTARVNGVEYRYTDCSPYLARKFHNLAKHNSGRALAFLRKEGKYVNAPRPDLVLLDLNLPKRNGREVLEMVKTDENLARIPIVILTTSQAEEDILKTYDLHANCYITKPVDLDQFIKVVQSIEVFWLTIVKLPPE